MCVLQPRNIEKLKVNSKINIVCYEVRELHDCFMNIRICLFSLLGQKQQSHAIKFTDKLTGQFSVNYILFPSIC